MMKSYLRYEPKKVFGLIASPQCNIKHDHTGNLIITGCLQYVNVWNARQAIQLSELSSQSGGSEGSRNNYPYEVAGCVTIIERCPDRKKIAVGYTNGEICLFNFISNSLVAIFRGHRSSPVISFAFDENGTTLASGGADNEIILWDTVSLTGICRLRGHKDGVTGIGFLTQKSGGINSKQLLVSVSKDTLLKVWDISTRYCIQTIVGHRSEIWTLSIHIPQQRLLNAESDNFNIVSVHEEVHVYTGASDDLIRGYRIVPTTPDSLLNDNENVLEYMGCIQRTSGNADKCAKLVLYSHVSNGNDVQLLAVQTTGKIVEIYSIRDMSEAKKKMKRRLKRIKKKVDLTQPSEETSKTVEETSSLLDTVQLTDVLELMHTIRSVKKIRSFDFNPSVPTREGQCKATLSLINNTLEVYTIPIAKVDSNDSAAPALPVKLSIIDMHGHRSDIRGITVSGDGLTIGTCSENEIKIWSTKTYLCTRSCHARPDSFAVSLVFAPGGRYIIVGTKEGSIQIIDTASDHSVFDDPNAHNQSAVWSMAVRPDGKGFVSGGADKLVKFWDFLVTSDGFSARFVRQIVMSHDVLSVRYNPTTAPDKLLVAIGLLDNTLKLFYDDSLRFFLSLYGHKLPIMCMDISYDSTILVSGSADKTIKIWGLDFGDCHRSLIAHEDSVTCIRFQMKTHYFFTGGKDGMIKYWDADRFEQILFLPGHQGPVWGLELSVTGNGAMLYSCGQDRSIRVWERGTDLVFIEEERERLMEYQVDKTAEKEHSQSNAKILGREEDTGASQSEGGGLVGGVDGLMTSLQSIESVKGGESLMEAIDLVDQEIMEQREYEQRWRVANPSNVSNPSTVPPIRKTSHPQMLGLTPYQYMLRSIRYIKTPDLEQALLILPFHYVVRLISILIEMTRRGQDIELCTKCCIFLMRCHQSQILNTQSLLHEMNELKNIIYNYVGSYRDIIGSNVAGLRYMNRTVTQLREDQLSTKGMYNDVITRINEKREVDTRNSRKESKKMKT